MNWDGIRKWAIFCLAALAFFMLGGFAIDNAQAPELPPDQAAAESTGAPSLDAAAGDRIQQGCQITQTMQFSRCGHSVTRRIEAPQDVVGRNFTEAQSYYDLWEIMSLQPAAVDMQREIPLFCPMHTVLSVNDAGEVVYSQNLYGDGMAVRDSAGRSLLEFSEEDQKKLIQGIGFDSREDAAAWLASH